jgi:hypothetical protein
LTQKFLLSSFTCLRLFPILPPPLRPRLRLETCPTRCPTCPCPARGSGGRPQTSGISRRGPTTHRRWQGKKSWFIQKCYIFVYLRRPKNYLVLKHWFTRLKIQGGAAQFLGGSMLLGQNLKRVHHLGFYGIFIHKVLKICPMLSPLTYLIPIPPSRLWICMLENLGRYDSEGLEGLTQTGLELV